MQYACYQGCFPLYCLFLLSGRVEFMRGEGDSVGGVNPSGGGPDLGARFALEVWLTRYLLPLGFLVFLTAHFWAPERHNYKVIVNLVLLMPALLSIFLFRGWRSLGAEVTPLLLVAAYLGYMVAISAWRGDGAGDYAKWSLMILLFLFAVGLRIDLSLEVMQRLLFLAVLVAGAGALFAMVRDWSLGLMDDPSYRMMGYGTMHNPLRTGHLFGAFALLGVWGAVSAGSRWALRVLMWLSALACLSALLMTGSRAPLLALFFSTAVLFLAYLRGSHRWLFLALLGVTVALVGVWFDERLLERGLSLRPDIWSQVMGRLAEYPWMGHGLGAPLEIQLHNGLVFVDTHNLLLAIQFYGGLVGVGLFFGMIGCVLVSAWRQRQMSVACLAGALQLYGVATLQFDGGSLIGRANEFWILYWLPVALCIYSMRIERQLRQKVFIVSG